MRSYLVLKEKARLFNEDPAIQARLAEIQTGAPEMASLEGRYSRDLAARLKADRLRSSGAGGPRAWAMKPWIRWYLIC